MNPLVPDLDEYVELDKFMTEASKHAENEQLQLQVIKKKPRAIEGVDKFRVVDATCKNPFLS